VFDQKLSKHVAKLVTKPPSTYGETQLHQACAFRQWKETVLAGILVEKSGLIEHELKRVLFLNPHAA
jgi:hypothetical protein